MTARRVAGEPKIAERQRVSLADAVKTGDTVAALVAMRDRLALELDECRSKRDVAALSRQLCAVLAQIEAWRPARTLMRDEIAAKRAKRRAAAIAQTDREDT